MKSKFLFHFHHSSFIILFFLPLFLLLLPSLLSAQPDSTSDNIYRRPFIAATASGNAAIGGYFEGNTNYFSENGVTEGFSMEARRFNIFLYSAIHPRIQFLSELEFEHGTEEIALETAVLDAALYPWLNFRAGILLVPIGYFNQNHDSPRWNFVERPLVSTQIIPATLSEPGFGFFGKWFRNRMALSYDVYLVNGLQDGIVGNGEGKTFVPAGKSLEMFEEDNNGLPSAAGRVSFGLRPFGDLGLSHYRGVYNSYRMEGVEVDQKRWISIYALDFKSAPFKRLTLQGEFAYNTVDVPKNLLEIYGDRQWGGYLEALYPIHLPPFMMFETPLLDLALRGERVDFNLGTFESTGTDVGDDETALSLALGFRPAANTVLKLNYRYHWLTDQPGNPSRKAGFQAGIASYF